MRNSTASLNVLAVNCYRGQVMQELSKEDNDMLDDFIVNNDKLSFMKKCRDLTGCSLREAITQLGVRYKILRDTRSDDFSISDKEYWDGFYS